ncbi:alpha/beta hydrolase family protein [Halobellus limi]|uniref:Alpha/beta fold hydrolase n=1 Tax=Halobellus limi TaxID=699433 RepID=A0A1H6CGB2_9EURY|nr:alpha/beta hydrolase family protein [Halobellus limi]QCC49559.1 alpha/beta fold hydrolase [Halobellus limi]SEG71912.1 Lysophospholipase, alpha-beta hydrolase superfamily [Halobellus limi]
MIADFLAKLPPEVRDRLPDKLPGVRDRVHSTESVTYAFDLNTLDYFFSILLSFQTYGGSEVGESFTVASRIDETDLDTWESEWQALAERVETRANKCLNDGHEVSAAEHYFRAYTYRRASVGLCDPQSDSEFKTGYERGRECFNTAVDCVDDPIDRVAIPFENAELPGYFLPAEGTAEQTKTLVMLGGGDTFVEDTYFMIAPAARKRDYNLLLVDLPGQGILPDEGLTFRPDAERPFGAVLDWLTDRPEVDPTRLGAFGVSFGGYLVPRAAAHDDRINACVANSIILDFADVWLANNAQWLARLEDTPVMDLLPRIARPDLRLVLELMDQYMWRFGADSIEELLAVSEEFTIDPSAIDCPTLLISGEQEYEDHEVFGPWQDEALSAIDHPDADLEVLPTDLGASSHMGAGNLTLMNQIVFDWLDDVLA